MKILLIEPSKTYARLLVSLLSKPGINIVLFHAADEALEWLKNETPDAVCTACEIDGYDYRLLVSELVNIETCTDVPKFLITSNTSQSFKRTCYDVGYTDIFYKDDLDGLKYSLHGLVEQAQYHIHAHILYIEDVPSTAAYTIAIMQQENWSIDHVHTGEAALEKLAEQSYDLVITDLILPGRLSGLGVISYVRNHPDEAVRNLPILAISGWNDISRQVYVLQNGASDFVSKPFKENDFLARSLNLIHAKRNLDYINEQQRSLYNKAHTDKLTGLSNRHQFDEYAQHVIDNSIKNNQPVTLMLIDIDNFKSVNDIHGHASGDVVLSQIGILLKGFVRQNDFAVRYGGEELLLLLPGCNLEHAVIKAEQVRSDIENLQPSGIPVTASLGLITIAPDNALSLGEIIQRADEALYIAKKNGRNQVHVANKC